MIAHHGVPRTKMQLAVWYVAGKIKRNLKLSDPKAWSSAFWNLYGTGETSSGISVNEYTALNLASVICRVNLNICSIWHFLKL